MKSFDENTAHAIQLRAHQVNAVYSVKTICGDVKTLTVSFKLLSLPFIHENVSFPARNMIIGWKFACGGVLLYA